LNEVEVQNWVYKIQPFALHFASSCFSVDDQPNTWAIHLGAGPSKRPSIRNVNLVLEVHSETYGWVQHRCNVNPLEKRPQWIDQIMPWGKYGKMMINHEISGVFFGFGEIDVTTMLPPYPAGPWGKMNRFSFKLSVEPPDMSWLSTMNHLGDKIEYILKVLTPIFLGSEWFGSPYSYDYHAIIFGLIRSLLLLNLPIL
jgi:hypothetical protein